MQPSADPFRRQRDRLKRNSSVGVVVLTTTAPPVTLRPNKHALWPAQNLNSLNVENYRPQRRH